MNICYFHSFRLTTKVNYYKMPPPCDLWDVGMLMYWRFESDWNRKSGCKQEAEAPETELMRNIYKNYQQLLTFRNHS